MGIHVKRNKVQGIYGHLSEMLNILSTVMNFSYSLVTPADRQWGAPVGDGNWTGMIGMLQRDEADIAMGPFAITYFRAQVVDYTHLFTSNYLAVMAGRLKDHHPSFFSYILTFGWEIWFGIFLSWVTLSLGMTAVDMVHNIKWRSWEKAKSRYMYHFWVYFSNLFCESSPTTPTQTSAKFLVLVWWLAIIVLMNGFSGNLKAKLMTEEEIPRIESIGDVLVRKEIQPYIMRGSAYETYIQHTQTEEFQQFWRRIVSTNGRVLEEMYSYETLKRVLRTEVVVVNDYWSMQDALARKCSDLSEGLFYFGNQHFFPHPFAMALNKRLPKELGREISKRVNWVMQSNIVSRWAARTNYNWTKCTQQDANQEEKPLTLVDLEGFFILYLLISAFCFIVLILENIRNIIRFSKRAFNRIKRIYTKFSK
ncbi:probable glutamate receptor [Centruroides sculpturatus]|uniref:probable glutamate receptor n=1 Tax=Centruroides sculpturatus TaxID=218467 RepID=UPI000C6CC481|nr:probable glutamate receptor [Centruroides sculpturatus]XP_023228386.1 probable glutamate receptor [Centruroides sculpturatus]